MAGIVNAILARFGLKLVRTAKAYRMYGVAQNSQACAELAHFPDELAADPLNPDLHLAYAAVAAKCDRPYLAYAELKSAEFLGAEKSRVVARKQGYLMALPDAMTMNHNQYFRFSSLAAEIRARGTSSNISILDVGGGQGELASFIRNANYCLAEPRINGISSDNLLFGDELFDYVVACHVLEHIPLNAREAFIDQLFRVSKQGVILLNPFHLEGTHVEQRLKLILEITGEQWANEHLDCTLPRTRDIEHYAERGGYCCEMKPNGTLTTSIAFVLLDYFARKSGQIDEWEIVNRFFNEKYLNILTSEDYPTAYMAVLTRRDRHMLPTGTS